MAVVQISKIQVRRGQKNVTGVPQLSSGEMAWTVDTQELFIGNGSVAEGAPFVGNTKVLTERDNILSLINSYRFGEGQPTITQSVERSIQGKLDEYVSVVDYGAVGDGSTDCTAAFQTALNELFRNIDTDFKKKLYVPTGTYLFLSSLNIPTDAIIEGESKTGTILKIDDNTILMSSSSGSIVGSFTSTNRPHNITLKNLTVSIAQGNVNLTGLKDSNFDNVIFRGEYVFGSVPLSGTNSAIYWENTTVGTKVDNLYFRKCEFHTNAFSVQCDHNGLAFDHAIKFDDCKFMTGYRGIVITGVTDQENRWQINDCDFEEMAAEAIYSTAGIGTLVQRSKFKNVGNGTSGSASPSVPIIYFAQNKFNVVDQCSFDRHMNAMVTSVDTKIAIPEVQNSSRTDLIDQNYVNVYKSDSFRPLAAFSTSNTYTEIDYELTLATHVRRGKLTISIDLTQTNAAITDHYQYSPPLSTSSEGILMTGFEFGVSVKDNDLDSLSETFILTYKNPTSTGDIGTISYSVVYGV